MSVGLVICTIWLDHIPEFLNGAKLEVDINVKTSHRYET